MLRWLVLDLNSFFASCEQQEAPDLRDRPVIVVQTIRKEIGNPTWVPRGVLSGGGWAYGSQVRERMLQIWREV